MKGRSKDIPARNQSELIGCLQNQEQLAGLIPRGPHTAWGPKMGQQSEATDIYTLG
jgi:hypothetical protein